MQETLQAPAVTELERVVPAMPVTGKLEAVFVAEQRKQPTVRHARARLVEQRGMANCHWARRAKPGGLRQVLLLDSAVNRRLGLEPGTLKENLLVDGLMIDSLEPGRRIAVGPEVLLEVTMGCPPCPALETIRPGLMKATWGYRGVLARVLVGGEVSEGDEVRLLELNRDVRKPKYPPMPR